MSYFCDFAVGNNRKHDLGFIMFVTGFRIEEGDAAVNLCKDRFGEFFRLSCNNFEFRFGFSEHKSFIKDESIDKSENDTVKNTFHGFENCKKNNNDKIKSIKTCGNGDMEKLVENKRRNIHAAGGSSGTNYEAESKTDTKAAEDGAEEYVVRKNVITENLVCNFEENRITERAYDGCKGKGFPEDDESDKEHGDIERENKSRNRNPEEMFDYKRNTGRSAKGDSGRKNEKLDAQCVNYIAENNAGKGKELLPKVWFLVHKNVPFKKYQHKKTFAKEFSLTNVDRGFRLIHFIL